MRSARVNSAETSGWVSRKAETSGATCSRPNTSGAATRSRPRGAVASPAAMAIAAS
ncbi:hypothetical protein ACFQU2_36040 [Siccirubricoccus deserti]